MGTAASKGAREVARKVPAKKQVSFPPHPSVSAPATSPASRASPDAPQPQPPSRPPSPSLSSPPPGFPPIQSTAANPASFLRGEGPQDIRDIEQEKYLRQSGMRAPGPLSAAINANRKPSDDSHELPDDLLSFLNDVGPAQKYVDTNLTALSTQMKDIDEEADKTTKPRSSRRERIAMPLMAGADDSFTATRNTNFSHSQPKDPEEKVYGRNVFEMFDHVAKHQKSSADGTSTGTGAASVSTQATMPAAADNADADETEEREAKLLADLTKHVELPMILKDSEGNLLGIYGDQFDPDIRNVDVVPNTKLKLVIQDIIEITKAREDKIENLKAQSRNRTRSRVRSR